MTGSRTGRPPGHRTIARRMYNRAIARRPPKIGRMLLPLRASGPRPTASPRMRRLLNSRTIARQMCSPSRAIALNLPTIGRAPLRLPANGLRRMSSRGVRLASSPTVPRLHHRHKKTGPQHLVLNHRTASMLLPRTMPVRRIRLLRDPTTIRLTKRRRTKRRISCPRHAQLQASQRVPEKNPASGSFFTGRRNNPDCSDRRLIAEAGAPWSGALWFSKPDKRENE